MTSLFKFGEFQNVELTPIEMDRLFDRFGEKEALEWIEILSCQKAAHGYVYISDYAAILAWSRRKTVKRDAIPPCVRPRLTRKEIKAYEEEIRRLKGDRG